MTTATGQWVRYICHKCRRINRWKVKGKPFRSWRAPCVCSSNHTQKTVQEKRPISGDYR